MRATWFGLMLVCAACDSGGSSGPVEPPRPTPPVARPDPIGEVVATLDADHDTEIASGDRASPIVLVTPSRVSAWRDERLTKIDLFNKNPTENAQWIGPGQLGVGFDVIDFPEKVPYYDTALESYVSRPLVNGIAWFPDGSKVALLFTAKDPDGHYYASEHDLFIVSRTTNDPEIHRTLHMRHEARIAAAPGRVLVSGASTLLFDAAGQVISARALFPPAARTERATFGAGMFLVVGNDLDPQRLVVLIDPRDGSTIATWPGIGTTFDAVPISGGAVAIDRRGLVRVGCVVGRKVETVAEKQFDVKMDLLLQLRLQVIGDRLAIFDYGRVRIAKFNNPCSLAKE